MQRATNPALTPTITPEGLARLTAQMPGGARAIYFYTVAGVDQPLNPGVETLADDEGVRVNAEKADRTDRSKSDV